jgi:S-DNA-T family DNA segregation ATPase FtsK/SpoIIIE
MALTPIGLEASMPVPRSHKIDVMALGLLALVLFLGVALVTYHPSDLSTAQPNISTQPYSSARITPIYAAVHKIANACGRSGAYVAEGLFRFFGWGAFFFVGSLLLADVWLLARRPLNDIALRAAGWIMALVGVSTMLALVGPAISPGPVIGPGGYLGAAGRALLEINFAITGAFILTASLLVGGLLLCTDYLVIRTTAAVLGVPTKFLLIAASQMSGRRLSLPKRKQTDLDNEIFGADADSPNEPAVDIRGKRLEGASTESAHAGDDEESDEAENLSGTSADQESDSAEDESAIGSNEAAKISAPQTGLAGRLASALRIRNNGKNDEREEVLHQLDAAANRVDEVIDYEFPSLDLLLAGDSVHLEEHEKEVRLKAKVLEKTFLNFGFKVKVVEIETGPVIAQYEVELEAGLRLSKITGLADDLAIALRVPSVRIVAPIPGKNTVGIEVPNNDRQLVRLREVIEETNGRVKKMRIPLYLGKDVAGNPMAVDLATLPHLLIAGRTGTGKSVCLNSIIVSMLMTRSPNDVRMLMIDPKMVELSPYKNLPHLMHPVVTDMRKAEAIFGWAVEKMEERYSLLARAGVRHISVYNQLGEEELMDRLRPETDEERAAIPRHLPYIVIVADEIADLMMTAAKEVEQHIIRLAQKSRAVGIHLVLATQKPTVDVITGLIKSNLPARICFQVASRVDSRVVLDEMGSEKLLGNGDMLFLLPGTSTLLRGQGTYVSDDEINRVLDCVGTNEPQFVTELVQLKPANSGDSSDANKFKNRDELYEQAIDIVIREGRGSVSLLQRALGIGYGRAARLVDYMAEDGIVGQYNGSQAREVLVTLEQWAAMCGQAGDAGAPPASIASPPSSATSYSTPAPPRATALSVALIPKIKRNRILPDPEEDESDAASDDAFDTESSAEDFNSDDTHQDFSDDETEEDLSDVDAENEADEEGATGYENQKDQSVTQDHDEIADDLDGPRDKHSLTVSDAGSPSATEHRQLSTRKTG